MCLDQLEAGARELDDVAALERELSHEVDVALGDAEPHGPVLFREVAPAGEGEPRGASGAGAQHAGAVFGVEVVQDDRDVRVLVELERELDMEARVAGPLARRADGARDLARYVGSP